MGRKISHFQIDVGVNGRSTKEIWQRVCFKVSVNYTKLRIERFAASVAPSTNSHANQENERSAEFGEASSDPQRTLGVSRAASTFRYPES